MSNVVIPMSVTLPSVGQRVAIEMRSGKIYRGQLLPDDGEGERVFHVVELESGMGISLVRYWSPL